MLNVKWKWQLETFTEVGKLPVPRAGGGEGSALGACRLARCVEAEKRTWSFAEARVENQVWREEEAGL